MSSFRFAGLRKPKNKPKVKVVKTPLWEPNTFSGANVDNDPIYNVSGDPAFGGSAVTLSTPTITQSVFHYRLPGTAYMVHPSDSSMKWELDKCFAFKCYFELDSISGRIPIFSRRQSVDSGGPFIEVRDGHVVCGWYDTRLKKEVWVKTNKPIIEPGYVYYLYYRKWFPRGGHLTTGGSLYYRGGNWLNSVHYGNSGTAINRACAYDALIVRRFPRTANSKTNYYSWCGYDAKAFTKLDTDNNVGTSPIFYNFYTNMSSVRACVSFVAEDSNYGTGPTTPYEPTVAASRMTPSGCVFYKQTLSQASTTGDIVAIPNSTTLRFLLDHVGMLLQIEDTNASPAFGSEVFRIVEIIDALRVRVLREDGTSPSFSFSTGSQYISIFPDVSLVKSPEYDASTNPDVADYAIETFGSSLAGDPLSGISQFNGKAWSFAWGMFTAKSPTDVDSASYKVGKPHIFEECDQSLNVQARITSGAEVGTDMFGLQGSTNPCDGSLPLNGVPAGELNVINTYARVAVDTVAHTGNFNWASPTISTAPSSTQPNTALDVALDASCTSTAAIKIQYTRETAPGTRRMRMSFYDPDTDEEGAPGDEVSFNVQVEDDANPSGRVDLVLSNMPVSTEFGRNVWRRVRMSLDGSSTYYIAKDIKDSSSFSASVPIDDIAMQALSEPVTAATLLASYGAPPRASYVAVSGARLVAGKLSYDDSAVAYSKQGLYSAFPVANVLPSAAGDSAITGIVDMLGSLVVLKRGAVLAYDLLQQLPTIKRQTVGDGCTSNASIVALEDRVYYMSDRGPMVLLNDFTPFFVGWRLQGLMRKANIASLSSSASGMNRQRGQVLMTATIDGVASLVGIEFQHPMEGEDTLRAEIVAGHRFGLYQGPKISSMSSLQRQGDGQFVPVAGTEEGFAIWMDRADTQLSMRGTKMEGNLGSVGTGTLQSKWSTKDLDLNFPELDKVVHYLDVSRPEGLSGILEVDVYRNRETTPTATIQINMAQTFSSEELAKHMQHVRYLRLVFRTPAVHTGNIFEMLDITLRQQLVDSIGM